jgi:NADH-quinone oxidoreductase subunit L
VARFKPLHTLLYNKYYFDEIYDATIIGPVMGFARVMWWFDANIIDGLVNLTGWFTVKWADAKQLFDQYVVDGAVNGIGYVCMAGAWLLKFMQSGSLQFYTLVVIASATGLVFYRVNPIIFYIYLAGVLIMALLRLAIRMNRNGRVKTGTEYRSLGG